MKRSKQFAATCGAGTEDMVAAELVSFGVHDPQKGRGVVCWTGDLESGYLACLWSRFASRIFLELDTFPFSGDEDIYQAASRYGWEDHFDLETTFAIDATITGEGNRDLNSRFLALRIKDGIVDRFRERQGARPSIDPERPGVRIHLLVEKSSATLSLDLSGDSLHRRGYRREKSLAPLKENLAAAIVHASGFSERMSDDYPVVDPMCGSATLLIEAALIYGDCAPGLFRTYFGFQAWKGHEKKLWNRLVEKALDRETAGGDRPWPPFIGYDADPQAVRAARKNVKSAGLEDRIRIELAELATLDPPAERGLLLSNLPFGERLSETEEVSWLYRGLGRLVRRRFVGWQLAVFIGNRELTDSFQLRWQNKYRLYNGALACRLLVTTVEAEDKGDFRWQLSDDEPESEGRDFSNRLKKNLKKMLKWAEKEGISCFRVYDRDLPEYNVSIDLYEKWVYIQEYAAPASVSPETARSRFQTVLRCVRETLGIRADRVFIRTRTRQRGKQQYQRRSTKKKMAEARENGCSYLVNFTDYLDTGLFLDHRPVRMMIRNQAAGKRFLNLFGYTGTATVQAAAGGAVRTTTVDLSANYLSWCRMNLAVNGFGTVKNRTIAMDCLSWLEQERDHYDLIFVDPPTFSNTKKDRRIFDVQRDQYRLLTLAMARLTESGLLIFSTNYRRFQIDPRLEEHYHVTNISRMSIPYDYTRNQKIHMCWEIRHRS